MCLTTGSLKGHESCNRRLTNAPIVRSLSEDYEELLDDAGLAEPSRRASELTGDPLYSFQQFAPGPAGASMIGVDIAIVRSILSTCERILRLCRADFIFVNVHLLHSLQRFVLGPAGRFNDRR